MPIFYALVARGTIVLTEHTPRSGNFTTVTRVLLSKINPASDSKMSYIYDDYVFHYMTEDGLTYLCLSDEQQKRRIPFLFLVDIKEKFVAAYGSRAKTAIAYAMPEFGRTLQDRMVRWALGPGENLFARRRGDTATLSLPPAQCRRSSTTTRPRTTLAA
jgi:vesicle-associated membrane protein 7